MLQAAVRSVKESTYLEGHAALQNGCSIPNDRRGWYFLGCCHKGIVSFDSRSCLKYDIAIQVTVEKHLYQSSHRNIQNGIISSQMQQPAHFLPRCCNI